MSARRRYWLMKSEPDAFSIDDLQRVASEPWTGVRNYQARNFMKQMKVGDGVLIYHSNCNPPGIAGVATVSAEVSKRRPRPRCVVIRVGLRGSSPSLRRSQPRWTSMVLELV